MNRLVNEEIVQLGHDRRLIGVLHNASAGEKHAGPSVVVLNAGIIHRVGPNRLFVRLARELAAHGHTVLRFDLSGIGDSAPDPSTNSLEETALADVTMAVDFLESRGSDRVVVVGLCSGTIHGFGFAAADVRVVGLVLIDPFVRPTRKYWVKFFASRFFRFRNWPNLITGRTRSLAELREESRQRDSLFSSGGGSTGTLHEEVSDNLMTLVRRGVQFYVVFTAANEQYNYRKQLFDLYPEVPFGDQLRLEYKKNTTHSFPTEQSRGEIIDALRNWLDTTRFETTATETIAAAQRITSA